MDGFETLMAGLGSVLVVSIIILLIGSAIVRFTIVKQYESMVLLRFGKFHSVKTPGLRIWFPIIDTATRVDTRIVAREVKPQEVMTKDNINIKVSAVTYYRVIDARAAVLNVQNYDFNAVSKTMAVLRDVIGHHDMNEILQSREAIAQSVAHQVEEDVKAWGLNIEQLLIQQIELPAEMVRAMAQRAVAERNRESVVIASTAEVEASRNVAKAALTLNAVPGALRLRELQTIKDISSEKNEKVIIFMPSHSEPTISGNRVEMDEAYIANMFSMMEALDSDIIANRQKKGHTLYTGDIRTVKTGADFTKGGADFTKGGADFSKGGADFSKGGADFTFHTDEEHLSHI
ncbi:MAG: SPFH domain-containing protein [Coriobacteriia bacterium]|nr:SPFH domain-containing protein [Coriobacteriia bacterium]